MKINKIIGNVYLEKANDNYLVNYYIYSYKFDLEFYVLFIHEISIVVIISTNIIQTDIEKFKNIDKPVLFITAKRNFYIYKKIINDLDVSIFIAILELIRNTSPYDSIFKSLDRKVLVQLILNRLRKEKRKISKNKLNIYQQIIRYFENNYDYN